MTLKAWLTCLVVVAIGFGAVLNAYAKDPVFVRWLVVDDPGDDTIRSYWERFDRDELSVNEMVDLGTMLFYRGYPKDAVRLFEAALDEDKKLEEAWFRIGLVEHQQGNHRQARIAYKKCLKLFKGHGWCNFYLALLEEQEGNAKSAMNYYRRAFRYAPVLADPEVNPELASSELSLGAWLRMTREQSFKKALPMSFLDPDQVKTVRETHTQREVTPSDDEEPVQKTELSLEEETTAAPEPGSGGAIMVERPAKEKEVAAQAEDTKKKTSTDRGRSSGAKSPQPTPTPTQVNDQPFGLPGTEIVSSEGRF